MISEITISHSLQVRDGPGKPWRPAKATMYLAAQDLANQGRLYEALVEALEIRDYQYNHSVSHEFRLLTSSETYTVLPGSEKMEKSKREQP